MITEIDRKLGKKVQKLRKKAGMTQEKLAESVSLSMKYIQFIESAKRKPSLKTVYKIASALKVKPKELF
ncbi:MAG: helix-turn-helix transcriptional regulator [Microgenomates group bacterium]